MAIDVVTKNPQLKKPVACVLSAFQEQGTLPRASVEEQATQAWSSAYAQDLGTTISVLVRSGALVEDLTVDGQPYAGTLQDMQLDESVPLEADVACTLSITEGGRALAASIDAAFTLRSLMLERPHYQAIYTRVLQLAAADGGASRTALEQGVEADGKVLGPDGKRVYPQYFMDALETAGGIEWKDGAWHATQAGLQALQDPAFLQEEQGEAQQAGEREAPVLRLV